MQKEKVRRINTSIIYGPVKSRRFGNSLGINLIAGKYCSFNCVYCFRGFNEGSIENNKDSFYSKNEVIEAIDAYGKSNDLNDIDTITIAGNGEPTDYPDLPYIIEYLLKLKNRKRPDIKINLLTNGMGFIPRINPDSDKLIQSIELLDQVDIKIDSAIPETWKKIGKPAYKTEYNEWFDSIKKVKNSVIQTMLMNGRIDNTTEEEIAALIKRYIQLKPVKINVITINKIPADSGIKPVPEEKRNDINRRIQREVFYI